MTRRSASLVVATLLALAAACRATTVPTVAGSTTGASGTVTAGGKPLAGVTLALRFPDGKGGWGPDRYPVVTKSDGTFGFALTAGAWEISATPPAGYVLADPLNNPLQLLLADGHPAVNLTVAVSPVAVPTTVPAVQPPPVVTGPVVLPPPVPTTPQPPAGGPISLGVDVDGGTPAATYTAPVGAPFTLHANVLNLQAAPGEWIDQAPARWDFGDAGGPGQAVVDPIDGHAVNLSTDQVGPSAAYLYERPGTYAVTCTRTVKGADVVSTATVTVPPAAGALARTTLYVDPAAGNEANAGTDQAAPLKTIGGAYPRFHDHVQLLLKRGAAHAVTGSWWMRFSDVVVASYGDATLAKPSVANTGPKGGDVWNFGGPANVVVRDLLCDGPWAPAMQGTLAYEAPSSNFGILRGRNVTLADVDFGHSVRGWNGDGGLHGGYALRCRQLNPLGVTSQCFWWEGHDIAGHGNVGTNSIAESVCRSAATGVTVGSLAWNDMGMRLDPAHGVLAAKAAGTFRSATDFFLYRFRARNAALTTDARDATDLVQYAAIRDCQVDGGNLVVKSNVRHLRVDGLSETLTGSWGVNSAVSFSTTTADSSGRPMSSADIVVRGVAATGPAGCSLVGGIDTSTGLTGAVVDPALNRFTVVAPVTGTPVAAPAAR